MTTAAEADVRRWVADACASLRGGSASYVEQIDLDDLLGSAYDVGTAVPTGLGVLAIAHAALAGADDIAPRLAVALADSPTLDTRLPVLDDVDTLHDPLDPLDPLDPPGLYLMRSQLEYLTGGTEEYRVAYDAPVCGSWVGVPGSRRRTRATAVSSSAATGGRSPGRCGSTSGAAST